MSNEYWIGSTILTSPTSSFMGGNYSIWGVAEQDIESAFTVKEFSDLSFEVGARVDTDEELKSVIDIRNISEIHGEMLVKQAARSQLTSRLVVRPKNSMFGNYEVIEPIPFVYKAPVAADTYIRSQRNRLNYGREDALILGNNFGDEYRTLIKYDLTGVPENVEIRKVSMVLQGVDYTYNYEANVFTVADPWDEYSTTWVNAPGVGLPITTFMSGNKASPVKVDVTDLYFKWQSGEVENNGVYLIKKSMESIGTRTYGSRESHLEHYLEVEYYDPSIYSFNMAYSRWGLTVSPYTDLGGSINVRPSEWATDTTGEVYVRDPENMPGNFMVSRPTLTGEIDVKYAGAENWDWTIRVPEYGEYDGVTIQIHPRANGTENFKSVLDVEFKQLIPSEFFVSPTASINTSLMIPYPAVDDTLLGTVKVGEGVNRDTFFHVSSQSNIPTKFTVSLINETPSTLFVSHHEHWESQFEVYPVSNLQSSIHIRANAIDDLPSQFLATYFKDFKTKIKVNPYDIWGGQIGVKVNGQLDLESVIITENALNLKSAMLIRQNDTASTITVARYGQSDQPKQITIRDSDQLDLTAQLIPRTDYTHEMLPSSVTVRAPRYYSFKGRIAVKVDKDEDTLSKLGVRVDGKADYPFQMYIRAIGEEDLDTQLHPRVDAYFDLKCGITARVGDAFDLDMVLEVGELPFKGYAYIM